MFYLNIKNYLIQNFNHDISWAFAYLLFEKILRILTNSFIGLVLAYKLGFEDFGTYSVIIATVSIFISGASMGSEHINISELSKKNCKDQCLASFLFVRICVSFLFFTIFAMYLFYTKPNNIYLYLIYSLNIIIVSFNIFSHKIQANNQFKLYSRLNLIALTASIFIKFFGFFSHMPLLYFIVSNVIDYVILNLLFASKINENLLEKPNKKIAYYYLKLCLPATISTVLVTIYLRTELFMINSLLGTKNAGIWAIINLCISPWIVLLSSLLPIINVRLAQLVNTNQYEKKTILFIRYLLVFSIITITINILLANILLPLLNYKDYVNLNIAISITSITILPLSMGLVQDMWIAHTKNTSIVLKKLIFGIPLSLFLLYYFIQQFNLLGACIAMAISYFTTAILMNLFFDRNFFMLQLAALGFKHER